MYHLRCPEVPESVNPCLTPGIEHRFQVLARAMLDERLSLQYTSLILNSPIDRLHRSELIMLCRIVSEDCPDARREAH